jgi:hypothetical protein
MSINNVGLPDHLKLENAEITNLNSNTIVMDNVGKNISNNLLITSDTVGSRISMVNTNPNSFGNGLICYNENMSPGLQVGFSNSGDRAYFFAGSAAASIDFGFVNTVFLSYLPDGSSISSANLSFKSPGFIQKKWSGQTVSIDGVEVPIALNPSDGVLTLDTYCQGISSTGKGFSFHLVSRCQAVGSILSVEGQVSKDSNIDPSLISVDLSHIGDIATHTWMVYLIGAYGDTVDWTGVTNIYYVQN